MKGVVLAAFSIIAISLSDAHYRKRPNIEVFEISENKRTKQLQVEPVELQYDLESAEDESQATKLSKLLLAVKKKKHDNIASDIIRKLKAQKDFKLKASVKKQKQPVVLLVSPEYLDLLDSGHKSDQGSLISSFLDETRSKGLLKPGSEVVFNIVPLEKKRKSQRPRRMPRVLRAGDMLEDRTNPPPPAHGERPYAYDDYDR